MLWLLFATLNRAREYVSMDDLLLGMDDLLKEFLTETAESIEILDSEVIKLEQNPQNPEILGNIFRLFHSIKGTCGFLGLARLEAVAHSAENVLSKFRDGVLDVTPEAVSLILESLDKIKDLLKALELTNIEPEGDDTILITRLDTMLKSFSNVVEDEQSSSEIMRTSDGEDTGERKFEKESYGTPSDSNLDRALKSDDVSLEELEKIFSEAAGPDSSSTSTKAVREKAVDLSLPTKSIDSEKRNFGVAPLKKETSSVSSQAIRVNVDLLENLMTMVSELVLTRNQLLQIGRTEKDSKLGPPLQRLSHVTGDLQECIMKTRMQPIGNAWGKLPRIIRNLSMELDKKIDLEMFGSETELDRQVIELIKDPITHMVRNSADHGIENPAERIASGKSETGKITLNAFHEGGHIIIEISDDGKGLNVKKIREKVIANGLATASSLEAMSDAEVKQFIFRAGFSTSDQVTSVSGRGVGMDVALTNIEKIVGTIDVKSDEGIGSNFTIKIPLTLAIVSALIIECSGARFAVPQISVVEVVRARQNSETKIDYIQGKPILRIRDRLLPLVSLRNLLKLGNETSSAKNMEPLVIVIEAGNYIFGIIVDRVLDTEEIVVKPLSALLREIPVFSGNTILGDGSVVMIIDPNGIAAGTDEITECIQATQETNNVNENTEEEKVALLIFHAGSETPKVVPLALIGRLEEIDVSKVEYVNGRPLIQYRGKLMPLVPIDNEESLENRQRQPILVFSDESRSMGLMVDEIVDIVEDHFSVGLSSDKPGILGSAIIAGRATEVIDTGYFLTQGHSDWFSPPGNFNLLNNQVGGHGGSLLLIDDSPFFRNLLIPLLSTAGYEVTPCEGPLEAIALSKEGYMFDIIISDISMPKMNGFELAAKLRRDSAWESTPLIALSAYSSPEDLEHSRKAGFSDYVVKFDREGLLQTLSQTMAGILEKKFK